MASHLWKNSTLSAKSATRSGEAADAGRANTFCANVYHFQQGDGKPHNSNYPRASEISDIPLALNGMQGDTLGQP